jgi:hypothetical protein
VLARLLARPRYFVPLALGVAIVVLAVNPVWATAAGLDVWNVPALQQEIAQAKEYDKVLTARDEEIQCNIVAKEHLIHELMAGRSTLADTTAAFLTLTRCSPEAMSAVRVNYPGSTDEERFARNVMHFVITRLPGEPENQQDQVRTRLEAELGALLGRGPAEVR